MKRIILILALLVAVVTVKAQQEAPADTASMAKIVFKELTYNYGTIARGSDGDCIFEFTNEGNMPLLISKVQASCGCTTPKYTKEPVMPSKSGEIKVHYDTNKMGAFSKTITVMSNAKQVVLRIAGNVVTEEQLKVIKEQEKEQVAL